MRKHTVTLVSSLIFACISFPLGAKDVVPPAVGDVPPDVLGFDIKGKAVKVSDYAGRVLVVSFWASWCGPCKKELPILEGLQRAGSKYGLAVVAVNWKDAPDVARNLVRKAPNMQMKVILDKDARAGTKYGVKAIPYMLLIGKDGKIAFINIGYGESVVDSVLVEVNKALAVKLDAVDTQEALPAPDPEAHEPPQSGS